MTRAVPLPDRELIQSVTCHCERRAVRMPR